MPVVIDNRKVTGASAAHNTPLSPSSGAQSSRMVPAGGVPQCPLSDKLRNKEDPMSHMCEVKTGTLKCTGLAACRGYPFLDSYRVIRVSLNTPQLVLGRVSV